MVDYLGWMATAVFASSYFFRRPEALRAMQMLGALIWAVYGVMIQATPVIAANVIVLAIGAWTLARARGEIG